MKLSFFTFFLSLYFFCSVSAQTGGQYVYSFLDLPIPARTAALGGNLIGVKDDDINLAFQNPSLLNKKMSNQLSLSYINHFADINYAYAAYSKSFDSIGHFAIGVQGISYGKFNETDEYGEQVGNFKANDYTIALSYGKELKDSLISLGISLKTILSNYYTYSSFGNAIDAGICYHHPKKLFTFSVVMKNLGRQWKTYAGTKEKLPFDFCVGLSKKVPKAPFRLIMTYERLRTWDLTYSDPNNPDPTEDPFTGEPIKKSKFRTGGDKLLRHLIVGTEVVITKHFNLRLGYNYRRRKEMILTDKRGLAGFSLGIGFKISKIQISYAFTKYHVAGNASNFTVSTNLSSFVRKS